MGEGNPPNQPRNGRMTPKVSRNGVLLSSCSKKRCVRKRTAVCKIHKEKQKPIIWKISCPGTRGELSGRTEGKGLKEATEDCTDRRTLLPCRWVFRKHSHSRQGSESVPTFSTKNVSNPQHRRAPRMLSQRMLSPVEGGFIHAGSTLTHYLSETRAALWLSWAVGQGEIFTCPGTIRRGDF